MPCWPWLVLKKGLSGDAVTGFKEFWIHRFICNRTGLTVSIHPRFSHFFKRFILTFVIDCLIAIIEKSRSIHSESKRTGVSSRTLRRWRDSFSKAESPAKHACFAMSGLSPPGQLLPNLLFNFFRQIGSGDLHKGAATGMVRLWEGFSRPLY